VAGRVRQITAGGGDPDQKIKLLRAYAKTMTAWAESAAATMVAAAARKNDQVWRRQSERIGQGLREHLTSPVNGVTLQKLIQVNAGNMKSLASDAADRLAGLTQEALISGARPEELAQPLPTEATTGGKPTFLSHFGKRPVRRWRHTIRGGPYRGMSRPLSRSRNWPNTR